jgi:Zn-dependent peptidase ImmA (M78 family)
LAKNCELLARLLDLNELEFDPRHYNFIERLMPGRIFELVEMLAQIILQEAGVDSPPVPADVTSLLDNYRNVEVRLVPLTAHHGAIWNLGNDWIIQLNKNDTPARRRFTLFPGAFHILAHCRATPVFRKRGLEAGCFNELVADYFAVCMLMPKKWVKEKWVEAKNISRIAEIFGVTEPQMWLRLKVLNLNNHH